LHLPMTGQTASAFDHLFSISTTLSSALHFSFLTASLVKQLHPFN
jgi:hypothetical protein